MINKLINKNILFGIVLFSLLSMNVNALSYYGFTDKFGYTINETIVYTGYIDTNINGSVDIYLIDASENVYASDSVSITSPANFTKNISTASVSSSGEYYIKANFSFNNTTYQSYSLIRISRASRFII